MISCASKDVVFDLEDEIDGVVILLRGHFLIGGLPCRSMIMSLADFDVRLLFV